MAGPSIMVRILGDASNLAKSATDVGSKFSAAAGKAHAAFSTMLGTLNQTGVLGPFGEALSMVDEGMSNLAEHGKTVSNVMMGAGGSLVAVGGLMSALGSKEQAAHQQLAQAIANTGHAYGEYGAQVDAAIKHGERFGESSVQTQNALQKLTQSTHDPAEALKLLATTENVAAAQHEDLSAAAMQVGQAYNNTGRLLKQYGIVLDKHTHLTKDGLTATQALAIYTKGQAAAASDTFNGRIKALSTTIEDQVSKFGEKYGPALQGAGAALTGLGAAMKVGQAVMAAFSTAEDVAAASTDAVAASEVTAEAAGAPLILIIGGIMLAIAALVAIAYVLYSNWNVIWGGIKRIAQDVWNWIRTNWPLLLGILTGPIGLAVVMIYKYWDQIEKTVQQVIAFIIANWNALVGWFAQLPGRLFAVASGLWNFVYNEAMAVWNLVAGVWNYMVGWIGGLPGRIYGVAAGLWNSFYNFAVNAWNGVAGVWNYMIGWLGGLPGRIWSVASSMWSPIAGFFKSAIDAVIGLWNQLHFTIGGWTVGVGPVHVTLPTVTVGMPTIPMLAAGGLITREGLIYAHAGEAITPAKDVGRMAPAVNIEHAHFAEAIDVDAFMARVAWAAQSRAV